MPLGKLGEAEVDVRLNNDQLDKDSKRAGKKVTSRFGRIGKAAGRAFTIGAGAIVAVLAGAAAAALKMAGHFSKLNRELKTAASRTGIAKDELQVLRNVAERLGSEDGLEGVTDSARSLACAYRTWWAACTGQMRPCGSWAYPVKSCARNPPKRLC